MRTPREKDIQRETSPTQPLRTVHRSAAEELYPLVRELRALSEGWRRSPHDPHHIADAVMVALLEVSNAIVRAYGEPPKVP